MGKRPILVVLLVFVVMLLALRPERSRAASVFSAGPYAAGARVLVEAGDGARLDALRAAGAQPLADYGAFSLWQLPADSTAPALLAQRLQSAEALPAADGMHLVDDSIRLRGITLTPEASQPAGPQMLRVPAASAEAGLWLVQFVGPPLPEWIDALEAAGLEVVDYIPNHAYLVWGSQAALEAGAAADMVRWTGAYPPQYRLAPELSGLPGDNPVDVRVQLYTTPRLAEALAAVAALALHEIAPPAGLGNTTVLSLQVAAGALAELAAQPEVINIEPYHAPELLDEIQGQILAGNLSAQGSMLVAAQPGYLQWLASKGFPQQASAYPLVDVFDDGMDSGNAANIQHPDFYVLGDPARASRVAYIENCTLDSSGAAIGGHGQLNAGILGGYNNRAGFPYQDSAGFRLGLGISPYGRLAGSKVFNNEGRFDIQRCGGTHSSIVYNAYAKGARISSNSWGSPAFGAYDIAAQTYDYLTRDASAAPGNQQMLHIFAAGNHGPTTRSIGSPGTAKNVLTVGALENSRDHGIPDGCGIWASNNADNVATFSSRGPTSDGRIKPDILAPGTHVQGPASLATGFSGNSICGGSSGVYHPGGQALYTWSSGTSHAAPAIAGVAQLAYNYYQRVLKPGVTPSPAMLKALILNTPRYLNGVYAGDTLPSATQGWGGADMGRMMDGAPRVLVDQETVFTASGQSYSFSGQVAFPDQPLHLSLVWTDAPGAAYAATALVNNLDLEVTVGGVTYYGNVFQGNRSEAGGSRDALNNVENIFLPAGFLPDGTSGAFTVRVIARGVNANAGLQAGGPNQDFALVISNATPRMEHRYTLPLVLR